MFESDNITGINLLFVDDKPQMLRVTSLLKGYIQLLYAPTF